ncbi:DUF2163 domain-containing protein [Anaplasma marginale]|uniref:Bacteriophage phiJL001 Gp84 C-terminal domain-containing protein n=2 Tax=Anaplasma TaxID=768 RepID=B9KI54_ANAMF|nr:MULTISPECIES: DUF2163 domain-containing protein [Anaplasma]AAV86462.1 hypothetical protein AM404 [Anaplasma marginale str. St. Maries]ACM49166.1 Conserved hypothetical protein [Anaplasma marginale str. Florida]ACZ49417.1 hypothetical protein ACIS_00897 [Anaplasma centrale str. Israel]RCL20234.1 DUF2163 domain-containing protein [Anaplasma marginale]TZF79281.1 DUF2163 domain-containing protein [Anaplasma marginale]
MKNAAQKLPAHTSHAVITTALCCRISAENADIRLTEHDENLEIDNAVYSSGYGINFGPIYRGKDRSIASIEITKYGSIMREQALASGQRSRIEVEIFSIDYDDVSREKITLFVGMVSTITVENHRLKISLEGIQSALSDKIGILFSPHCRAQFCDSKCKLDRKKFTFQSTVDKVVDHLTLEDTKLPYADCYYKHGVVTFLDGENRGISVEVRGHRHYMVHLARSAPYPILPGDAYSIIAGCDKNFLTCSRKFDNTSNFRGEPHVPDLNSVYQPLEE